MSPTRDASWSHPAALPEDELLAQCEIGRGRTSGPGGQHRNKVQSQVKLTHQPTGIGAQAGERRSVRENRPVAVRRLRLRLATELRCAVPLGEIGSECWRSRVRRQRTARGATASSGGRLEISARHWDFPSLLAEALDVLADGHWDLHKAAIRLEVSSSQIVKLLKSHPPAIALLNAARARRGERELK